MLISASTHTQTYTPPNFPNAFETSHSGPKQTIQATQGSDAASTTTTQATEERRRSYSCGSPRTPCTTESTGNHRWPWPRSCTTNRPYSWWCERSWWFCWSRGWCWHPPWFWYESIPARFLASPERTQRKQCDGHWAPTPNSSRKPPCPWEPMGMAVRNHVAVVSPCPIGDVKLGQRSKVELRFPASLQLWVPNRTWCWPCRSVEWVRYVQSYQALHFTNQSVHHAGRRRVKVSFCKTCDLSDPARLLLMGYIAASPSQPRTAFSVRLLKYHHALWIRCAVPTQGFCEAFDDVLDDHCPVILTSTGQVSHLSSFDFTKFT